MSVANPVELGKLGRAPLVGEHFTDSQEKSVTHSKVAAVWASQCMSFQEGREKLAEQQEQIEDFPTPLNAWLPVVNDDGKFALQHKESGREYLPTENGIKNIAYVGGMYETFLAGMSEPRLHATKVDKATGNKVVVYERNRQDAELVRDYVKLHLFNGERVDQTKPRLFRTWKDGTLRALLSEQYAIVNNAWFLNVLAAVIPGGLLSHWKGDADAIFGNILIPDTIREEKDSPYGGMLSISNSEIGTRRIGSCPSVFRAICMNGCIWEQEMGTEISKVHRGAIDFITLEAAIRENLQKQIPLLPQGIDKMLATRAYGIGDTPLPNLFAQLSIDNSGMGKKEINGVWGAFAKEVSIVGPTEGRTLFGLVNAITRYGQELTPALWESYDKIGGSLINLDRNAWDKFRARAANLDPKTIEKRLGVSELTLAG